MHDLAEIRPPEQIRCFEELIVAVDVQNPLLGPTGCTRIYGPQKGLLPSDFDFAERCLQRLADVLRRELHRDCADEPGSGAAGGSDDRVEVVHPNGQRGTIPRSQLDKAKKKGYRVAQ